MAKPNYGYQKRQKELEKKRKKEEKRRRKQDADTVDPEAGEAKRPEGEAAP